MCTMNIYDEMNKLWKEFKEELKHKNRFFSGDEIVNKLNRLKRFDEEHNSDDSIVNTLKPYGEYIELYRARIGDFTNKSLYADEELLNPPPHLTKAGRCNPRGVSYLYLASNIDTAIHEVKPSIGDKVTVAKILVNPQKILNFNHLVKYDINKIKTDDIKSLVKIINSDLSSAVTVNEEIEYLPFQFLAEYIKNREFDGFAHSSSVADGINYIVFNCTSTKVESRKLYNIDCVKCEYHLIEKNN